MTISIKSLQIATLVGFIIQLIWTGYYFGVRETRLSNVERLAERTRSEQLQRTGNVARVTILEAWMNRLDGDLHELKTDLKGLSRR